MADDREIEEKFWDVIGLYLNPPDRALVLCCDEKSQCQALERTQLGLPLAPASFWFARHTRRWRLAIIAFASATQLVPMVVRHPVLLFPLLGALVPVAILVGCLVALSKKGGSGRPPQGS